MKKERLDVLVVARGLADSVRQAQAFILAGKVVVDEHRADKAGTLFPTDCSITLKGKCPFVSRGGIKLQAGLQHFNLDPTGLTCADIGASTGGFTDCLLQNGAALVYAVDVGYGQLHWKLRQDPRVVVMERTNARHLTQQQFSQAVQLAVVDASFISLTTILPALLPLFKERISILALIKPQFEVQREDVGPGGVVFDSNLHNAVIDKVQESASRLGLCLKGPVSSPIRGPKGNKEFLVLLHNKCH